MYPESFYYVLLVNKSKKLHRSSKKVPGKLTSRFGQYTNHPSDTYFLIYPQSQYQQPKKVASKTWDSSKPFHQVRQALVPGGIFYFDLNMHEGYLKRWKSCFHITEKDSVCVMDAHYDSERRLAYNDFTLFTPEDQGWKRSDFTLTQKAYSKEEVFWMLSSAGFRDIDTKTSEEVGFDSWGRMFFKCKK